jgi:hypothetical protein
MKNELLPLIEELILIELNVADLYLLFSMTFKEDSSFWWQLTMEEKNHAALVRSAKEIYESTGLFPQKLVPKSVETVKETNRAIRELIAAYKITPPTREDAMRVAYGLEKSAGEIHFQEFMESKARSTVDDIFQSLSRDDRDHSMKIRSYMERNGFPMPGE